jgi:hypothetical protein
MFSSLTAHSRKQLRVYEGTIAGTTCSVPYAAQIQYVKLLSDSRGKYGLYC